MHHHYLFVGVDQLAGGHGRHAIAHAVEIGGRDEILRSMDAAVKEELEAYVAKRKETLGKEEPALEPVGL